MCHWVISLIHRVKAEKATELGVLVMFWTFLPNMGEGRIRNQEICILER